ncbi:MAG: DUF5930 domain-containing protein [Pseudomonadota bacterium]
MTQIRRRETLGTRVEQEQSSTATGLGRVIPERRIYVRTDKGMQYTTLRPATQLLLCLLLVSALAWTAFTSGTFIRDALDGHQEDLRLVTMREAYEAKIAAMRDEQRRLEGSLEAARTRADVIGARLSEKQKALVKAANDLQEAKLELTGLRDAYTETYAKRERELDRITDLESELASMQLEFTETATAHDGMTDAMQVFAETMEQVIFERDSAQELTEELSTEVETLSAEVTRWEGRQERVMTQLEEAARTSLEGLEKVFNSSDLDLDRILRQTKRDYTGSGGPFVPVGGEDSADNGAEDAADEDIRLAALVTDFERIKLMRIAAERLPLGQPVYGMRLTSGFGPRRDPFKRRIAMHNGIDWAGPRGTPIYATGHGVVTFVGWQKGYGRVVKIKHAFGFETVYAHLSRARVKVGQEVERGDRIADMGNTGRSTGTHLHYEVRIGKEPVNPAKFIEAARDVL